MPEAVQANEVRMHRRSRLMSPRRHKRGFVLLMVMFVTSGMLTLTAVGMTRSITELRAATRIIASEQAFQQAESEAHEALAQLSVMSTQQINAAVLAGPDGDPTTTADNNTFALIDTPYAAGPISVAVFDNDDGDGNPMQDTDGILRVRTSGTAVGGVSRRIEMTFQRGDHPLEIPLFGGDLLRFGGNAPGSGMVLVDSYDSRLGPYGAPLASGGDNRGAAANVGTNADNDGAPPVAPSTVAPIDIRFERTTNFWGGIRKVAAAQTSYSLVSGSVDTDSGPVLQSGALCNGGLCSDMAGYTAEIPRQDLPSVAFNEHAGADSNNNGVPNICEGVGGLSLSGSAQQTIAGDVCYTAIVLRDDAQVTLLPGARVFLKGTGNGSASVLEAVGNARVVSQGNNEIYGLTGRMWIRSNYGLVSDKQLHPGDYPGQYPTPRDLRIYLEGNLSRYAYNDNDTPAYHDDDMWDSNWSNPLANGLEQGTPFYGALYIHHGFLWVKGVQCSDGACSVREWANVDHYGAIVAGDYLDVATHSATWVKFHMDLSLLGNFSLTGFGPRVLLWRELAPEES